MSGGAGFAGAGAGKVGAVELGGSHVSAARVSPATWRVDGLRRTALPADASRAELIDSIVATAHAGTSGTARVGVAAPGPFDYDRGICLIRGLGKLESLYGTDLRRELSSALGLEPANVTFLNDAEAFALGESLAGAAQGQSRVLAITLGTGLGSAFLAEGEILRDGPGVPPDGSLHLVPFRGRPAEETIAGRGLEVRHGEPVVRLAELARDGDSRAREAFAAFGADLAEFLAPWIRDFRPTCVVVGGSIARAWDLFGDALETATFVTPAARLDEAALLGAAAAT